MQLLPAMLIGEFYPNCIAYTAKLTYRSRSIPVLMTFYQYLLTMEVVERAGGAAAARARAGGRSERAQARAHQEGEKLY